jgi:hypothetical protein
MNLIYPIFLALLISLIPFVGVNVNVRGQIAELDNMTSSDNATKLISIEEEDKCSTKIGSAGMEFPYEKKTECEKQEWDQCIEDRENGIKWDDRCKDLNEGFFDDCEGYTNKEECDEAWYTPPVDDSRSLVQPGCIEPNEQGECYIGMPGEKLPTPIEEAQNQNENQDNDNNDNDISEVEETEENWFN